MLRSISIQLAATLLVAVSSANGQDASCNAPSTDPLMHFELPGQPFQALPSADGCWIFVSLTRSPGVEPSIALVARRNGALKLVRTIAVPGGPTGMVVTHDGKLLIVAAGESVLFLDIARLESGETYPVVGTLTGDVARAGRVYANVTANDAVAFISDERAMSITVIDLAKARQNGFKKIPVIGRIPVGTSPIALTFSPDERWLYTTSQTVPAKLKWPDACKPQAANDPIIAPNHAKGAIIVVDMHVAVTKPEKSVVGYVSAGCSPVRLILSPDGTIAYVTARADNMVLTFDTRRFLTDSAHARLGQVTVGSAPVGMALVADGRTLIVTNSNRFAGNADDKQSLSVLDVTNSSLSGNVLLGSIPAGAFPRELRVTSDGQTLIATNFASRTLELVDLTRLKAVVMR